MGLDRGDSPSLASLAENRGGRVNELLAIGGRLFSGGTRTVRVMTDAQKLCLPTCVSTYADGQKRSCLAVETGPSRSRRDRHRHHHHVVVIIWQQREAR